ncbi:2Fe-2S iron-sulfur cluster binding domain-containing protein [Streptomyces sp. p1417]|uniref:2Fe-2S iron-sulfur cluster binding domain-containing protein n=1 Tax=Streptomyces typhae TaxID=2681492 RepID=A0A6L6WX74_9ACTN|nr:PDR/VanB family oxidoreductase [Streptomyces typhae]MVO85371.1 2Fe-2S iron-sulfur cluster binding domain-containing protein [Streptomyces typhae]
MQQHTVIDRAEDIAEGVVSLLLRGTTGSLAPWEPGAHIDLSLPNWLTRSYSLCGDPADAEHYRVAVRHDPLSRGGSEYIHHYIRAGRALKVSLPRNHFPLLPAPRYLFLAGGIGITPLLPMLAAAVEADVPATLVYAGRSAAAMPFAEELRSRHGDRVRLVATREDGRPDLTALAAGLAPDTLVYCCGPAPMIAAAQAAFPADRLHTERFRPAPRVFAENKPFDAVCARSGRTVPVPADQSLLNALNRAGIPVAAGCREGVCGSCEITVLSGTPEHRDDIGASDSRVYACVSRALTPELVIDR